MSKQKQKYSSIWILYSLECLKITFFSYAVASFITNMTVLQILNKNFCTKH